MVDTPVLRKARGAFFTPVEISQFIADWAIRSPEDTVLEPSCGEARFLLSAGARLRALGGGADGAPAQLQGIEVHGPSAHSAQLLLAGEGLASSVEVGDFFEATPSRLFDVVIGNPPYVRYQKFSGEARNRGLRAALQQGVRLSGLASSWAAFVVHASRFLKRDGRLGLVLPAELLTVKYAAPVRSFLLERFANVKLVMFEKLVFPEVLEEVVVLLAEGTGAAARFELHQAQDPAGLQRLDDDAWTGFHPDRGGKWTPALLPSGAFEAYQRATRGELFSRLIDWGETYLGAVTGNNGYFSLTSTRVDSLGLREEELVRISPPGSRHLRGLALTNAAWQELAEEDKPCHLFYPRGDHPSRMALRYIDAGEKAGVHSAYKCRVRKPWWRVPLVPEPDLLLTYMDQVRPRLVTNEAGVRHLNSVYGVRLKAQLQELGRLLLPLGLLNSVSLLGAEIVGRAYGGGLLKLEPKEADLLPVPSPALSRQAAQDLMPLKPQLEAAVRGDQLLHAVELVDRAVLMKHLGMKPNELKALQGAREILLQRRTRRRKGSLLPTH